jgi:DNA-binding transcriptional LysR family regulator
MSDLPRGLRGVTLRQLRTFHAVARLASFTAAARELHVTQPAISMQIKELEDACGNALYERIGRRVQLTAAGQELAACAGSIFELLADTHERIDALAGLRAGTLKLGAVSTAEYFTPALLAAFRARHPGIAIQFKVGNREDIVRRMRDNEFDLAVMGRPPAELATVATRFAEHPLVVVASPQHPLARASEVSFARLASEHFLLREPGSGTRAAMEEVFAAHAVSIASSMEMSSNEAIKQAVIAGLGLALISAHTIGLELATGRLVTLAVRGLPLLRHWYVIHLAAKRLAPIASGFRDFLLDNGSTLINETIACRV